MRLRGWIQLNCWAASRLTSWLTRRNCKPARIAAPIKASSRPARGVQLVPRDPGRRKLGPENLVDLQILDRFSASPSVLPANWWRLGSCLGHRVRSLIRNQNGASRYLLVLGAAGASIVPPAALLIQDDRAPFSLEEPDYVGSSPLWNDLEIRQVPVPAQSTASPERESVPAYEADSEGKIPGDPRDIMAELLRNNSGLFVGDDRDSVNAPAYMRKSLQHLKEAGAVNLAVGALGPEALQHYLETRDVNALRQYYESHPLARYTRSHTEYDRGDNPSNASWAGNMADLVAAAIDEGLTIVPLSDEGVPVERGAAALTAKLRAVEGKTVIFARKGFSANYLATKLVDWQLGIPAVDFVSKVERDNLSDEVTERERGAAYVGDGRDADVFVVPELYGM